MKYFEYTAFYQDNQTVHHLSFIAAVDPNQIQFHGLNAFRVICWQALNKRVQTTALLIHWVTEIPAADVSDMAIYPAAEMQTIDTITTT